MGMGRSLFTVSIDNTARPARGNNYSVSGLFFPRLVGHISGVLSREMRIAFYCGIVAFASQDLMSLGEAWAGIGVLFPYVPLLAIPAFQLRSRMLAFRAVLLGPALVLIQTLAGLFFALDSRIISSMAIFVPGGWNSGNPGGPVEVLLIHLAFFWVLVGGFMRAYYRGSNLFGLGYLARWFGAGFALEVLLACETQLTTVDWEEALALSDTADRIRWVVASLTWLLACGVFSAFVFGVKPVEPPATKDAL
jgi:hypothetical protein